VAPSSRLSKLGHPRKVKDSILPRPLPFYWCHLGIPNSQSPAQGSTIRYPLAFSDECHSALKHLKRLSPQPGPYIGSRHSNNSQDDTLTMHLLLSFHYDSDGNLHRMHLQLPDFSAPELNTMSNEQELLAMFEALKPMAN